MISEEALRQAAAEANDCLVRSLDEAGIPAHNFSARFERKMRRLIRRTRHPAAYRALIRVACAFLAFLLGSGVFLAVNPEARAAFFGWVRTQYERLFVYDVANTGEQTELPEYTLGWLPEGYEEVERYSDPSLTRVIYTNTANNTINFLYFNHGNIYVSSTNNDVISVMVNGQPAEIYNSHDTANQNNILWRTSDGNILFQILGNFNQDILIHMAESIEIR